MENLKAKVYDQCIAIVRNKVTFLQQMLEDVIESTKNETKSSAGDKYETGRAMLQIEQDNIRKQLFEALQQKAALEKIELLENTIKIVPGSLVKTGGGYFFVSIGIGKILVDQLTIMALSPQSPLGYQLLGKKVSETIMVNGKQYTIESIC